MFSSSHTRISTNKHHIQPLETTSYQPGCQRVIGTSGGRGAGGFRQFLNGQKLGLVGGNDFFDESKEWNKTAEWARKFVFFRGFDGAAL